MTIFLTSEERESIARTPGFRLDNAVRLLGLNISARPTYDLREELVVLDPGESLDPRFFFDPAPVDAPQ